MIRSANHSSYPRLGDNPLDQRIRSVLRAREQGRASDADVAEVCAEATTVVVAEQARAFIDVVTDGMVGWEGPASRLARHLGGLALGELRRWFATCLFDRRLVVEAAVEHSGEPFLVHDFELAHDVAAPQRKTVKVALPGPVTLARLARDEHYHETAALAEAFAEALAVEVEALSAAGASTFQLDEPWVAGHPEDAGLVARTAGRVFDAAGDRATTILSIFFGDPRALTEQLATFPGTHLGLDVAGDPARLEVLRRLPAGRGVVLGVLDATAAECEDANDIAASLAPYRDDLVGRDVIVGPNAGLELLPRDHAFDKLLQARYLVDKLSEEWTWPC